MDTLTTDREESYRGRWLAQRPLGARPIEMHAQDLWRELGAFPGDRPPLASDAWITWLARFSLAALTIGATAGFASGLYTALALQNGGSIVHYAFLFISTLAFSWIAFGAANALIGAVAILVGRGRDSIAPSPPGAPIRTRTALLFPIYHEDPRDVAATITTVVQDLEAHAAMHHFDVFVLSDTQAESDAAIECATFARLAKRFRDSIAIVYRNRIVNSGKKAGNVADWVQSHGGAYDHFIVFDADSLMTADTLTRLAATMEAHPDTALIQTVPRLIAPETWFARLQAYANNMFGPLSAAGLASWQGASGNYWGHNAIVRTRAFASSAGLPVLPGRPPWGGHIQSHDFVEAALLRRDGWRVALVTSLAGTYERSPPTLIELSARDRRWMQGNLQHARVLSARGLSPISRLHLIFGIASYLSSALWLLMIVIGLYLTWLESQRVVSYFDGMKSLFPNWPTYDPAAALRLLLVTMLVVLTPKLLGLLMALGRVHSGPHRLAGILSSIGRWLIELLHSALVAPVQMLLQVQALVELVLGRDSGWKAQQRVGQDLTFRRAFRFHRLHVLAGAIIGVAAASESWHTLLWISPIVAGLLLAPAVTWLSSHPVPESGSRATRRLVPRNA